MNWAQFLIYITDLQAVLIFQISLVVLDWSPHHWMKWYTLLVKWSVLDYGFHCWSAGRPPRKRILQWKLLLVTRVRWCTALMPPKLSLWYFFILISASKGYAWIIFHDVLSSKNIWDAWFGDCLPRCSNILHRVLTFLRLHQMLLCSVLHTYVRTTLTSQTQSGMSSSKNCMLKSTFSVCCKREGIIWRPCIVNPSGHKNISGRKLLMGIFQYYSHFALDWTLGLRIIHLSK